MPPSRTSRIIGFLRRQEVESIFFFDPASIVKDSDQQKVNTIQEKTGGNTDEISKVGIPHPFLQRSKKNGCRQ